METVQEGGGRLPNGSAVTKTPNRLRIVESDEDDKVTSDRPVEMDPYRELELYLAKVNVSLCQMHFLISLRGENGFFGSLTLLSLTWIRLNKIISYQMSCFISSDRVVSWKWRLLKKTKSLIFYQIKDVVFGCILNFLLDEIVSFGKSFKWYNRFHWIKNWFAWTVFWKIDFFEFEKIYGIQRKTPFSLCVYPVHPQEIGDNNNNNSDYSANVDKELRRSTLLTLIYNIMHKKRGETTQVLFNPRFSHQPFGWESILVLAHSTIENLSRTHESSYSKTQRSLHLFIPYSRRHSQFRYQKRIHIVAKRPSVSYAIVN